MLGKLGTILFLVIRDITKRRLTFFLIIIALSFTFFNLLVSNTFLKGMEKTLMDGAIGTFGHIYISPPQGRPYLAENEPKLKEILANIPAINSYSPHLNTSGIGLYKGKTSSSFLVGITKAEIPTTIVGSHIKQGKFLSFTSDEEVVLGLTLADTFVGFDYDEVLIPIGEKMVITGADGVPRTFTVVGIVDTKNFVSNYNFYVPKTAVEKILGSTEKLSEVVVKVRDGANLDEVTQNLKNAGVISHVASWRQPAGYINSIVTALGILIYIISIVSLLVGGVITGAILYVHTERKKRQIGILKALGTSTKFVVALFLTEAMFLASLGILVGTGLYSGFHYYFNNRPIELLIGDIRPTLDARLIVIAVAMFVGASLIAGLIPSYKASKATIKKILWER